MIEEWKDIIGYEGFYQISNLGNARSVDRLLSNHTARRWWESRMLRQITVRHGYPAYILSKNQRQKRRTVHRLLAIHFIPNPENKPEVNHINGIKTDYRLENLEWSTRKENMRHASVNGLILAGEKSKSAKLTAEDVRNIRSMKGQKSEREIAKIFGVAHCTIGAIHRNKKWNCHDKLEALPAEVRREKLWLVEPTNKQKI